MILIFPLIDLINLDTRIKNSHPVPVVVIPIQGVTHRIKIIVEIQIDREKETGVVVLHHLGVGLARVLDLGLGLVLVLVRDLGVGVEVGRLMDQEEGEVGLVREVVQCLGADRILGRLPVQVVDTEVVIPVKVATVIVTEVGQDVVDHAVERGVEREVDRGAFQGIVKTIEVIIIDEGQNSGRATKIAVRIRKAMAMAAVGIILQGVHFRMIGTVAISLVMIN